MKHWHILRGQQTRSCRRKQNGISIGISMNFHDIFRFTNRKLTIQYLLFDSRDPSSLVKPLKSKASPEDENKYNERLEAVKPTAVRHLILIRHGQYNLDGATDADRFLTEVGRKQAGYTGERLNALKIPFDLMIRSTMTRAQETGKIISTHIANLPIENCPLIEEGAPIAPQPAIGHWHPEPHVSVVVNFSI